jgi:hypothetical protein
MEVWNTTIEAPSERLLKPFKVLELKVIGE